MVSPSVAAAVDGLAPAGLSGEFATLYLALERETVLREFLRLARHMGRAPDDFLPRRFYRYSFELSGLLDLLKADARAAVGLTDAHISGDDLGPCQVVGEAAHYLGREGVVAPSATGAGTVLAVFFDRLAAGSLVRELDYETWQSPPVSPEQ